MNDDFMEIANSVLGVVPEEYDLTQDDTKELINLCGKGIEGSLQALTTAFRYGVVMGHRLTEAGKYKITRRRFDTKQS
jgi:hypothetical protein